MFQRSPKTPTANEIDDMIGMAGIDNMVHAALLVLKGGPNLADNAPARAVAARVAGHAHDTIVRNLAAGDSAGHEPVMAMAEIIGLVGAMPALTAAIQAGLDAPLDH